MIFLTPPSQDGRQTCDTPTSPGDFTSLSNSTSDQNLSPLTPSSLAGDGGGGGEEDGGTNGGSDMDLILPGIPNLRDEDGLPLKHPSSSSSQTTPPQVKTTPPQSQGYRSVYSYVHNLLVANEVLAVREGSSSGIKYSR